MYFKKKNNIQKLGSFLKQSLEKKHIWKGVDASRVSEVINKISEDKIEWRGIKMISWKDKTLLLKVKSSLQRQEIMLKRYELIEELRKNEINVNEIKINL